MKVLFLDLDGVVNSTRYFMANPRMDDDDPSPAEVELASTRPAATWHSPVTESHREWVLVNDLRHIDQASIPYLNEIVARSGAKVVITSTWRHGYRVEGLQWLLDVKGFKGEVIGVTPDLAGWRTGEILVRGHEVLAWLKATEHHVEAFACLDDDTDSGPVYENWVRTDFNVGVTQENVEECLSLLLGFDRNVNVGS